MTPPSDPPTTAVRPALAYTKWLAWALLLPAAGGVVTYRYLADQAEPLSVDLAQLGKKAAPELPVPTQLPNAASTLSHTIEFVVRRNDTMERIFRQLQLNVNDLAAIRALPDMRNTLDQLQVGDPITFTHQADGSVQSVSKQVDMDSRLVVTRDQDGFHSALIDTPVTTQVTTVRGEVASSLYASAIEAGLSADVIMQLANDIFGWDIDFALDIQRGDRFAVLYEKHYREGHYVGNGRILSTSFTNNGKTYQAVRFDSADGQIGNYFTPEGRSMRRQFLRAPLDFTRISSGFSLARFHPVLNRIRAHKGIDYAAATGTPIKAAGDGRVVFTGKQGGYGNVIILDHGRGITTLYGHMSRFARARSGSRVKQGDIIGYVGMTGLATGPHLHYEYRINGVHKDPRGIPTQQAEPIPGAYMSEFQAHAKPLLAKLEQPVMAVAQSTR